MIAVNVHACPQNHPCPPVRYCPEGAIIQKDSRVPDEVPVG